MKEFKNVIRALEMESYLTRFCEQIDFFDVERYIQHTFPDLDCFLVERERLILPHKEFNPDAEDMVTERRKWLCANEERFDNPAIEEIQRFSEIEIGIIHLMSAVVMRNVKFEFTAIYLNGSLKIKIMN